MVKTSTHYKEGASEVSSFLVYIKTIVSAERKTKALE